MTNQSEPGSSSNSNSAVITPAGFEPMKEETLRPKRRAPLAWLIVAVLLLLAAVAAFFLFTSRSVEIVSQVSDVKIDVDGGLSIALANRRLLRPGSYSVTLQHPEYVSLNETIAVTDADNQRFEYLLQRKPDSVTILTEPLGATVLLNGVSQGISPLDKLSIASGEHKLEVRHPRYRNQDSALVVQGGGNVVQKKFILQPAWAEVELTSLPSGAEVFSGEDLLGTTPITAEVLEGDQELLFKLKGHKTERRELQVAASMPQSLELVELQLADAELALNSVPSDAGVLLNGGYVGQTPLTLDLVAGADYTVELFKQGFAKRQRSLKFSSGSKEALTVSLAADIGEVELRLGTDDVKVTVNGKAVSAKSGVLQLPAVPQTIRVSRAGYTSFEKTITPRPGFKQRIDVSLRTPQQARAASTQQTITTSAGQTLRLLTPGKITLGASRREAGRRANEALREVTLERPFYMSVYEVTNGEFRQFNAGHSSGRVEDKSLNSDAQPVVRVNWEQAAQYCNWLSERDQLKPVYQFEEQDYVGADQKANGYRLPTEAEWAWAARVLEQQTLKFPWGQNWPVPAGAGNFAGGSAAYIVGRILPNYDDGFAATAPVGKFRMNQFELYDLGGNVAEWVHDYYAPGIPPGKQVDPFGPASSNYHVVRGSSWRNGSQVELRLSYRDYADGGRDDLGFRLVRYAQ